MKRFLKIFLCTAIAIFAFVLLLVSAILFTETGRSQVISIAIEQLEKQGVRIELVNFQNPSLSHIAADLIAVEQTGHKLVEITNFDFKWQPSALLSYKVAIENIAATSITIFHAPPSEKEEKPEVETSSGMPNIPAIEVKNIALNSIKLKNEANENLIDLSVLGALELLSLDKNGINFNLSAADNSSGKTLLTIKTVEISDKNIKKLNLNFTDSGPMLIDKFTPKSYFESLELALEIDMPEVKNGEYSFVFSNSFLKLDNETIGFEGSVSIKPDAPHLKLTDFNIITSGNTKHSINGLFSEDKLDAKIVLKEFPLPMLNLFLEQDITGAASADIILKGSVAKPNVTGRVNVASNIYKTPLTLDSSFTYNDTLLELEALNVLFGKNYLKALGNYNVADKKFDFNLSSSIKTADIPKELLADFAIDINAAFAANINLVGTLEQPQANGSLSFTDIDQDIKASIDLTTTGGNIIARSQINKARTNLGVITLNIPQKMLANLANGRSDDSSITANGTAKLESFSDLLDLSGQSFSGNLKFDASVKPTPTPVINANVSLVNGAYDNTTSGTYLRNIVLQLDAVENKFNLRRLSIDDRKKGKFSITGGFELKDSAAHNLNLKITSRDMNFIARSDVDANISADIALTGGGNDMLLKGVIDIFPLTVYPANLNSYSIPQIEVKKANPQITASDVQAAAEASNFNLALDLTINADKQASIISKDINAELGGQIKISGTAAKPDYSGSFKVVRGWLELLGKRFVLEKDSEVKIEEASIYLDLTATHSAKDKVFKVNISGFQDSMKFNFSSDPAMPQDEVLSNLMFDKSSGSITPMQAVNLAQTLNSLRGGRKTETPLSKMQNLMSANNITIGQGDDGGMNLGMGRYLTDKVYMELTADSDSKNGNPVKTRTEIELRHNINLESETGGSSGIGGVSLQWKNDY
jgi:autotransporter translocation and assembly factor TamB